MIFKRIVVFGIPLILVLAWVAGARRMQADLDPHLLAAVPGAQVLRPVGNGDFAAYRGDELIGYVRIDQANGYGGPMNVAVGVDTTETITGLSIVDHKESTAFFRKVTGENLSGRLVGKSLFDPLQVGDDVDAVTGATRSSRALVESVRKGARTLGARALNRNIPEETPLPFRFGWPEIVLLLLFALGFAGSYTRIPKKQSLRWISRILGLVFIGFAYCAPLTITNINSLLMGYLPDWRDNFYWYLLIVGVLLPVLLSRQRPYCNYVCPFGAVQDCLRLVSGKTRSVPGKLQKWLRWFHGILVLGAIVVGLYMRNPGPTSYEVFGSMFDLTGMTYQFIVLGVVLIVSLFVARPWCRFLCPIQGVSRYLNEVRSVFRRRAAER
jgi:hypothetical protein